jgi:hypothetical protein
MGEVGSDVCEYMCVSVCVCVYHIYIKHCLSRILLLLLLLI